MRTFLTVVACCLLPATAVTTFAQEANPCFACHEIDAESLGSSPHGSNECLDCHAGAQSARHRRGMDPVDCAACHGDVAAEEAASAHGGSSLPDLVDVELPVCTSCHGDVHTMVATSDPASPVHPARQGETCAMCHGSGQPAAPADVRTIRPVEAYTASVHAAGLSEGLDSASCSKCHSAHSPLPAENPLSSVHRSNVPATCGACHDEITVQFEQSIHGLAAAAGVGDSPVCTDCHGEHRILSVSSEGSPVYATNIPIRVCGPCHSDLRLGEKYDLPADQVPSYEDSFHGLASRSGVERVANCASCHGVHDILPSSHPDSSINADNLSATCGKCHPGAGTRFTIGPVHVIAERTPNKVAYWIRAIYVPLIWVVVAGMLLHNVLDLVKKTRDPEARRRKAPPGCEIAERMSLPFRMTHGLAAVSFIVLVFTGFALKYPESWWVGPLQLGGEDGELRGLLHRIAAVGLMVAVLIHFAHLMVSSTARRQIAALIPGPADIREFIDRLGYNLGRRTEPPAPVRVGYIEKVEYWAALWGTLITAFTGLILWFENLTLSWLPGWVPEAATVLHFLEAVLATLAILIWHFYSVMFDPVVYPLDTAWLTGKAPFSRAEERGEVTRGELQYDD